MAYSRVTVYREGGLGDLILQHFEDDRYESLASLKRSGEPIYARLILNTHNPSASDLFRYTAFDEIEVVGYKPGLAVPIDYADVPNGPRPSMIPGCPDDWAYIDDVLPADDFAALHPFTSSGLNALRREDVDRIANRQPIVVVGSSRERFEVEHPNVTNLIGLANPRLVCGILRRSIGFIGTLSCYCWAAVCQGVPARAFRPEIENDPYISIAHRYNVKIVTSPDVL